MDDFHTPQRRDAPEKSTVTAVLDHVRSAGDRVLSLLSGLLAAALILYSGYVLYDSLYTQNQANSGWELLQYRPEIIDDGATPLSGAETLAAINQDYRAWLTMYETSIDYPVLQGENDLYYASHDVYGKTSLTGSIYLAAGNSASLSDSYNLIYGHHMDNGAMFGALDAYADAAYRNAHREGVLVSQTGVYDLYVFAVAETDAYESAVYSVGDRMNEVLSFLKSPGESTNVLFYDAAAADGATKVAALSTCASAETNGRLVVFATMTRRPMIDVTATDYSGAYDGAAHGLDVSTSVPEGTTIEYSTDDGATWTTTPPTRTDVGTTAVLVRATNEANGEATTEATITVTPAEVTVTANPATKTYGDADPAFTSTVSGLVGGDTVEYTVSRSGDDEDAGSYPGALVPAGGENQGNYHVTYVPGDFTIEAAPLHVTPTGTDGPYDGEEHTVTVPELPEGSTVEYSTDGGETWTPTPPSITDVGEVEVVVRVSNPNYEIPTETVTLRVTPAEVTVTANPAAKTYGGADPAFTATVRGLVGGDSIEYTVSRSGDDEDAGSYPGALVPAGGEDQGNYHVTYVPGDFTIEAAPLHVTPTGTDGPYDGEEHTVTVPELPEGSTVEYSTDGGETWTTTPPSITDVGEIEVVVRVSNPNYETSTETVTLRVTPAEVTVTANPATKSYGDADPAFTATVSGLVGGDTVEYTVSRSGDDEETGRYPGALVPAGGENQGNYHVTYVPGDFEIVPSDSLSVTATDYSTAYDGEEHTVVATVNVPEGTTVEYSTDGGETWTTTPPGLTDVGEIEVVVRVSNPNYETSTTTVTLRVTPAEVTVTANPATKTYGDADPAFTATVSGLVGGDTIRYTVGRAGADEDAGSYPGALVPAGGENQGNYHVTYVPGDFTIEAAPLHVTPTGTDGPYDGEEHTVTVPELPEGSTVEYSTDGGETWTTTPPSITDVGEVEVVVRVSNPNYETSTTTVTLRVTPRAVTVTANPATKSYGDADPTFTATVSGLVGGDSIEYTVSRSGDDEAAGSYPGALVPAGGVDQGNYHVTYVPGDFTIEAAPLRVTPTGTDGPYDGEEHTVTVPELPEDSTVEYSTDGGETWTTTPPSITDVGEIEVVVRVSNPNYETSTTTVTLRVTPRAVTVTANDARKQAGAADPAFTATVSGLVGGDTIRYTVGRVGGDESAGIYRNAIVPSGDAIQGNYRVTYIPATFIITTPDGAVVYPETPTVPQDPDGPDTPGIPEAPEQVDEPAYEVIDEPETPLAQFVHPFEPRPGGTADGRNAWALVNLICLLVTLYLFIPLTHLKAKFSRGKMMKKVNAAKEALREAKLLKAQELVEKAVIERQAAIEHARAAGMDVEAAARAAEAASYAELTAEDFTTAVETLYYQVKKFLRRFRAGLGLELLECVLAVVAFVLTEDIRLPMILIDRWTPLMILLMALCWLTDVRLVRYRNKVLAVEEQDLREEIEKLKAR